MSDIDNSIVWPRVDPPQLRCGGRRWRKREMLRGNLCDRYANLMNNF